VIVGALALALAAFLPLDQATGLFSRVQDNTLIQHGGWALIALAVGIAASSYRVTQGSGKIWVPILLCVIAGLVVIGFANNSGLRTLYPIGPDGTPDTSQPGVVASLGLAIYVAGVGAVLPFIGCLMIGQSSREASAADDALSPALDAKKQCPDCAEIVLAEARVCKHCGYRFGTHGGLSTYREQEYSTRCEACSEVNMVHSPDDLCFTCGERVGESASTP
jgi:Uncharacterised protein family UPF0547